jgi:hypothetical protein
MGHFTSLSSRKLLHAIIEYEDPLTGPDKFETNHTTFHLECDMEFFSSGANSGFFDFIEERDSGNPLKRHRRTAFSLSLIPGHPDPERIIHLSGGAYR